MTAAADRRPVSPAVAAKAIVYLREGRLTVRRREGRLVEATCAGTHDYTLGHDGDGDGWHCDCPAYGLCAHLVALQLVTTRRQFGGQGAAGEALDG